MLFCFSRCLCSRGVCCVEVFEHVCCFLSGFRLPAGFLLIDTGAVKTENCCTRLGHGAKRRFFHA